MPNLTAQVAFIAQDGLPRDQMENVFHFIGEVQGGTDQTATYTDIQGQLQAFYSHFGGYMSPVLNRVGHVKIYSDSDPSPRPILFQGVITIPAASTSHALPEEVALCLSYWTSKNAPGYRGRVYLGPWGQSALVDSASTDENGLTTRPAPALIAAIVAAGAELAGAHSGGTQWALKSSKRPALDQIVHGWCDNEWDSQRRRRLAATSRVTF